MSDYAKPEDLRGVAGIRRRPAMYVGDCGQRGLHQLIFELFDNAVDQYFAKQATKVQIEVSGSTIRISDDGPGLPFDLKSERESVSLATDYMTRFHNRATADGHAPHLHFRGFGVGMVAVCALSKLFVCRSWRTGQCWQQEFACGIPLAEPHVVEIGSGRGTSIEFQPDEAIFGDARPDPVILRPYFFEATHLIPGMQIEFQAERFASTNGIADLLRFYAQLRPCTGPVFSMHSPSADFEVYVTAAGSVVTSRETDWMSWCNGTKTHEHGTHKSAFAKALGTLRWAPAVAMIHVIMTNPQFGTPTKAKLTNSPLETPLAALIRAELTPWCRNNQIGKFSIAANDS